eukprot:COSAG02_NODE_108_length_36286_cov_19.437478_15_plen_156_part_00
MAGSEGIGEQQVGTHDTLHTIRYTLYTIHYGGRRAGWGLGGLGWWWGGGEVRIGWVAAIAGGCGVVPRNAMVGALEGEGGGGAPVRCSLGWRGVLKHAVCSRGEVGVLGGLRWDWLRGGGWAARGLVIAGRSRKTRRRGLQQPATRRTETLCALA